MRVIADECGADAATVAQRNVDLVCAMYDVAVGERETVGREDEARSTALVRGWRPRAGRLTSILITDALTSSTARVTTCE